MEKKNKSGAGGLPQSKRKWVKVNTTGVPKIWLRIKEFTQLLLLPSSARLVLPRRYIVVVLRVVVTCRDVPSFFVVVVIIVAVVLGPTVVVR